MAGLQAHVPVISNRHEHIMFMFNINKIRDVIRSYTHIILFGACFTLVARGFGDRALFYYFPKFIIIKVTLFLSKQVLLTIAIEVLFARIKKIT